MELVIGLAIAGILFAYFFFQKKPSSDPVTAQQPVMSIDEATAIVNELDAAGYYKYTDPENIPDLKDDLVNSLSTSGVLSTIEDFDTSVPLDYRYYCLDCEMLYEQDGVKEQLETMQPTFDKIGLALNISHHIEEVSPDKLVDHRITINGKHYTILTYFDKDGWGETAQRFVEILNDQLTLQQKDEQLYLINAGNDGGCAFLTDEQFSIIDRALKDELWKPLKVTEWCRVFKVNPESYKGLTRPL